MKRRLRIVVLLVVILIIGLSGCNETLKKAEVEVKNLEVNPSIVEPGEIIQISVEIENIGDFKGVYNAVVNIDGAVAFNKDLTLNVGESKNLSFSVQKVIPKNYTVEIGGLTANFTVISPANFEYHGLSFDSSILMDGGTVNLSVDVTNVGDIAGSEDVVFKINNQSIYNQSFTLSPLGSVTVSCNHTAEEDGKYLVSVGDLVGNFSVYSQDQIDYFFEIVLGTEYGGSEMVIRKWVDDIRIEINGTPTEEDLNTVEDVIDELNALIGEPELRMDEVDSNLIIYFVPESEFEIYEPNYVPTNYGYFFALWNSKREIYHARVLISTEEITQQQRSHLIREELTQSLGLMQDSNKYSSSIFYQGISTITEYAEIDKIIIELLYKSEILPKMNQNDIETLLKI